MLWFDFTCFVCDGLCLKELVFGPFCFCMHSWCSLQEDAVLGLLQVVGEPWCFDQLMIDSVLNLLFGKFLFCVAVFALMSFLFSQSIWCSLTIWCSFLGKVVLRLLPLLLAALWLDQLMINSVPILLITQVFSVWLSFFELSFGFSCHLILLAYVMFRLERGCSQLLPSIGWTLVLRVVNDRFRSESYIRQVFILCGGLCSDELSFFSIHLMFLDYLMFLFRKSCSETTAIVACSLVTRSVDD